MYVQNLRIAIGQINPTVGELESNLSKVMDACEKASQQDAEIILFGELAISGYPIGDLALRRDFLEASERAIQELVQKSITWPNLNIVVGYPRLAEKNKFHDWAIAHNSAAVILNGSLIGTYDKRHLPNYTIFDEWRNYVPGEQSFGFQVGSTNISVMICEDMWRPEGPVEELRGKADVCLVLNGSPFEKGKNELRRAIAQRVAKNQEVSIVYANLVGGQDDLVFDGDSFVLNRQGLEIFQTELFAEQTGVFDLGSDPDHVSLPHQNSRIWDALVQGLRDYVEKNSIPGIVLGLSGGIDSAVCAVLATDAIGPERVKGIGMPSIYSSDSSITDAQQLAENLGIDFEITEIKDIHAQFQTQLNLSGLANENIQSRIRALILMADSNNSGRLLLSTGNKSEIGVGYSTIYGDSAGGFAPLKDVYKTEVYQLAEYRNTRSKVIPENSITKPPSAELRPDQHDQQSLPDYEVLDAMLDILIENHGSVDDLITAGYPADLAGDVTNKLKYAEWKRAQGAIGPRISKVSFGRGRRMPIANGYL
ncbi:MAG TPA: NAD+ synthase [Microbacteriaceae bacterium]